MEASITTTWWWWGTCLITGEGAFLQAKLEARVPTPGLGNACHGECCRRVDWEEEEAVFGSQLI